jgi:hypothetical protein
MRSNLAIITAETVLQVHIHIHIPQFLPLRNKPMLIPVFSKEFASVEEFGRLILLHSP